MMGSMEVFKHLGDIVAVFFTAIAVCSLIAVSCIGVVIMLRAVK